MGNFCCNYSVCGDVVADGVSLCAACESGLTRAKKLVDVVNHPKHYTAHLVPPPGEVIDVIEAWKLPFHLGNTVKYIARHTEKGNPLEDLKKARWYLDRYIAALEAVDGSRTVAK